MEFLHIIILLAVYKLVLGADTIELQIISNTSKVSCPPWTLQKDHNNTEPQCECGNPLSGVVQCNDATLQRSILMCYCMTYSEILNKSVVGHCIYYCRFLDDLYLNLPVTDADELNERMCTLNSLHRTGQNCGSCRPGYAPAAYSYRLACVECKEYKYNWLKYIGVAILPLTVVYMIVLLFRISITTGTMNTYVMTCQIIAAPVQTRLMTISAEDKLSTLAFNLFSSTYMIWNLDIFRPLYQPFCLHPKANTLHILALEYSIAIYPLLLIVATYIAANLHDRFIFIVRLWRPFYRVFAWFRREWNIRSSLIDAFATFIVLSYVKVMSTSFDLLTPVALYDVHGNRIPQLYLYYDGTVEYFGKEHLPFAILALFMFVVFNLFPLLLFCLYPCRCVHRCLAYCRVHSHVLHTFMDTFQGCFKTQPYDCRYFAGIYLGYRMFLLFIFGLTTSPLYYAVVGLATLFVTAVVAIARPYERQVHVALDVVFFILISVISLGMSAFAFYRLLDPGHVIDKWYRYGLPMLLIAPLYGIGLLLYRLIPRRLLSIAKNFMDKLRELRCCKDEFEEESLSYGRLEYCNDF